MLTRHTICISLLIAATTFLVGCTPSAQTKEKVERKNIWKHMNYGDAYNAPAVAMPAATSEVKHVTPPDAPPPSTAQDFGSCSAKDLTQFSCD
jgi:hypothetical protein